MRKRSEVKEREREGSVQAKSASFGEKIREGEKGDLLGGVGNVRRKWSFVRPKLNGGKFA